MRTLRTPTLAAPARPRIKHQRLLLALLALLHLLETDRAVFTVVHALGDGLGGSCGRRTGGDAVRVRDGPVSRDGDGWSVDGLVDDGGGCVAEDESEVNGLCAGVNVRKRCTLRC